MTTTRTVRDLLGTTFDAAMYHPLMDRLRPTRVRLWFWKHFRPGRYESLKRINLGCGENAYRDWCNIDVAGPADLHFNFLNPFPLPDAVSEVAYCEHALEHFQIDQVPNILAEVCRILKPGGVLRVSVPRVRLDGILGRTWSIDALPAEALMTLNRRLFGHDHHATYSFPLLKDMMLKAGFKAVQEVEPGVTAWFPQAELSVVEHRKADCLVVEAKK